MKNKKEKYSSYKSGLEVGDLVYFNILSKHFFVDNTKYNAVVLGREFLYEKETRFGIRKFFRYTLLGNISGFETQGKTSDIFNIETRHIRVLKTIKPKKDNI